MFAYSDAGSSSRACLISGAPPDSASSPQPLPLLPAPGVVGTYRGRRPNFAKKPGTEPDTEVAVCDPYQRDPFCSALRTREFRTRASNPLLYIATSNMEESTKTLAESLSVVKVQRVQLKRYLDMDRVMDALKSASTMLSELRTSSLTPKHYYELYMAVFDALRHLSIYLYEAHVNGKHHLADLYELVQYCGHIVPRLYLMVTVGSVYMSVPDAPVKEIMKDMTEMCRGVQHPTRGLFLRHYLSGTTRDHLPTGTEPGPAGDLHDSVSFVLANFVEMNKLWVRQQHLGHSREREKREMERRELRILVGTNLVRLSQLEGVTLEMYQHTILPAILEQVIHCKDAMAQEYLVEVIIQVFSDDFHLHTLHLLSACTRLHPKVSVKQLVISLINRLAAYASREAENETPDERKRHEDAVNARIAEQVKTHRRALSLEPIAQIWQTIAHEQSTKRDTWRLFATDLEDSLPDDGANIWSDTAQGPQKESIWGGVEEDAGPDTPVETETEAHAEKEQEGKDCDQPEALQDNAQALHEAPEAKTDVEQKEGSVRTFRGIPENVRLFEVFWEQIVLLMRARTDLSMQDVTALLLALLNLCLNCYPDQLAYVDQVLGFAKDKFTEALEAGDNLVLAPHSHFQTLLLAPVNAYASALTLLGLPQFYSLWSMQPPLTQRAVAHAIVFSMLRHHTLVASREDAEGILELCAPLLKPHTDAAAPGAVVAPPPSSQAHTAMLDEMQAQQSALARMVHLFHADDVQVHLALLHIVRRHYAQDVQTIRTTFPPLVLDATLLIRRYEHRRHDKAWDRKIRTLFQFVHQLISTLYHAAETPELCVRLVLLAAEVADEARMEDLAYEFYVQAFTILEESVSDSRAQLQALGLVISTLYKARVFKAETYDTLATKAAIYAAKLLKRPQQATAVLMASHLWWQVPPAGDAAAPGLRNARRVLECLQKTLRIADGCLDEHATVAMFCDALGKYLYYYELGVESVSARHINSLAQLVAKALECMPPEDGDGEARLGTWRPMSSADMPTNAKVTRAHFVNVLRYVESKKRASMPDGSDDDDDAAAAQRRAGPDWHALQTSAILARLSST